MKWCYDSHQLRSRKGWLFNSHDNQQWLIFLIPFIYLFKKLITSKNVTINIIVCLLNSLTYDSYYSLCAPMTLDFVKFNSLGLIIILYQNCNWGYGNAFHPKTKTKSFNQYIFELSHVPYRNLLTCLISRIAIYYFLIKFKL